MSIYIKLHLHSDAFIFYKNLQLINFALCFYSFKKFVFAFSYCKHCSGHP